MSFSLALLVAVNRQRKDDCGLEEPTRGQIKLGGEDITKRPGDRNMAMVFQSAGIST